MRRQTRQIRKRPEGLRPFAAAFAVFALLIQALMPMAAMAAEPQGPAGFICALPSSHAAEAGKAPAPARPKGFAGMPCQDCVAAAAAVIVPPVAALSTAPAMFVRVSHHVRPTVRLAFARAPPRPPGQGPPTA